MISPLHSSVHAIGHYSYTRAIKQAGMAERFLFAAISQRFITVLPSRFSMLPRIIYCKAFTKCIHIHLWPSVDLDFRLVEWCEDRGVQGKYLVL